MWKSIILSLSFISIFSCKSVQKQVFNSDELQVPHSWDNYQITQTLHQPIRTIQLTIHVFQDSLGANNFQIFDFDAQRLEDWYWLNGLVEDASQKNGVLQPMNMKSSSPYISDCRIRYKVVEVHEWRSQELFELNRVSYQVGNRMYDYIINNADVGYKENSLHLFFAGGINLDNNIIASRGIASGLADKKWCVLFNYYHHYKNQKNYWPAGLISHEIGHNLGLRHTWNQDDGCSDTPQNPYHLIGDPKNFQCWNSNEPKSFRCDEKIECSNNMMDYNADQNALTQCQVQQIHYNINRNRGDLQDIIEEKNDYSDSLLISGKDICKGAESYELLNCPLGVRVEWFVSPRKAAKISEGIGTASTIEVDEAFRGKAILTFRVHYPLQSVEIDKTIRMKPSKKS